MNFPEPDPVTRIIDRTLAGMAFFCLIVFLLLLSIPNRPETHRDVVTAESSL